MKFNVEVIVEFKKGILDPQSQAIGGAISSMGYSSIKDIAMSKRFNLTLEEQSHQQVEVVIEDLCKKLLANPVIENYKYTIISPEDK